MRFAGFASSSIATRFELYALATLLAAAAHLPRLGNLISAHNMV
jgi:hypothetical protein